jgi:hypothetical protein
MNYVLVALVLGCITLAFILLKRHNTNSRRVPIEKQGKQTKPSNNGHNSGNPTGYIDNLVAVPARIYDNFTRTVKTGMLPAEGVRQIRKDYGNLGRRWEYNGEWVYSVVRLVTGKYVPTQQYMTLSLDNPPERLHRALQQQETEAFYRVRDNRSVLAKYGAYLLFAGVVIVILFLWGANMMQE